MHSPRRAESEIGVCGGSSVQLGVGDSGGVQSICVSDSDTCALLNTLNEQSDILTGKHDPIVSLVQ